MKRLASCSMLLSLLLLLTACNIDEAGEPTQPPNLPEDATLIAPTAAVDTDPIVTPGVDERDPTPLPSETAGVPERPTGSPVPGDLEEVGRPSFRVTYGGDDMPMTTFSYGRGADYDYAFSGRWYDQPAATNIEYSMYLSEPQTQNEFVIAFSTRESGVYEFVPYTPDAEGIFATLITPNGTYEANAGEIELSNDGILLDGTFEGTFAEAEPTTTIQVEGRFLNMPVNP